jgi:hypothetical protein
MKESTLEDLTQRVDHLERENRRLEQVGAVVLAGVAVVVLVGLMALVGLATLGFMQQGKDSRVAQVVEAEQFILRDSKGRNRGGLDATSDIPKLILTDEGGFIRASLGVGVGSAFGGQVSLGLFDLESQGYVALTAPRGKLPHLEFVGRGGKVIWKAP